MTSPTLKTYVGSRIVVPPMQSSNLLCTGGFFFQQTELSMQRGEDTSSLFRDLPEARDPVDIGFTLMTHREGCPEVHVSQIETGAVVAVIETKTGKLHWVKVRDMTSRGEFPPQLYILAVTKLCGTLYQIVFLFEHVLGVARSDAPAAVDAASW